MSMVGPWSARAYLADAMGISVSAACVVHCLAIPAAVAFLPAWSDWLDLPETFHVWALAFAFPFSLAVLFGAARRRRSFAAFWLGLAGLLVMAAALLLGEAPAEPLVTSGGAILLAAGHVVNWRRRGREGTGAPR